MTQVEVFCKNSIAVSGPRYIFNQNLWVVFTESETQEQHISLVTPACPQSLTTEAFSTPVT